MTGEQVNRLLARVRLYAKAHLPRHLISSLDVTVMNELGNHLCIALMTNILSIDEERHMTILVKEPASWIERLKEDYLPEFLKVYFPVKYTRRERDVVVNMFHILGGAPPSICVKDKELQSKGTVIRSIIEED